jgi:hypothetical protein
MTTVSVRACKEIISTIVKSDTKRLAPMLWGPPGIGKSSLVEQATRELGLGFKEVIAHLFTPQDVLGFPFLNPITHKQEFGEPTVFPDPARDGERGIFFIDEIPNSVPAMMSAWGIIILTRSTKVYTFPPGWFIVCAGNNATDRAGSSRLISALENRLMHLNVVPELEEFFSYAFSKGFNPTVLSFLRKFPDFLIKFDPKSPERGFPSPRSWEQASDVMKYFPFNPALIEEQTDEPVSVTRARDNLRATLSGVLGDGAALEFMSYLKTWKDMPDLEDILSGKADLKALENRVDLMRAVVMSVMAWVGGQPDPKRVNTALDVVIRMNELKAREYPVFLAQKLWELAADLVLKSPSWQPLAAEYLKFAK